MQWSKLASKPLTRGVTYGLGGDYPPWPAHSGIYDPIIVWRYSPQNPSFGPYLLLQPSLLAPPRVWILPSSLWCDMLYLRSVAHTCQGFQAWQLLYYQDITNLSSITPWPLTPPCWYFYFCLHLPQPFQQLIPLLTFRAQFPASSFPPSSGGASHFFLGTVLRFPPGCSPTSQLVISLVHLYTLCVLPGSKCPNTVYWAVKVNLYLENFLTSPIKSSAF